MQMSCELLCVTIYKSQYALVNDRINAAVCIGRVYFAHTRVNNPCKLLLACYVEVHHSKGLQHCVAPGALQTSQV